MHTVLLRALLWEKFSLANWLLKIFFWSPEPIFGRQLATGIFFWSPVLFFGSQEYFSTIPVLQFVCQVAKFIHHQHHYSLMSGIGPQNSSQLIENKM